MAKLQEAKDLETIQLTGGGGGRGGGATTTTTTITTTEIETDTEIVTTPQDEEVLPDSSTKKLLSNMTASRRLERFLSATDRAPAMNLEFVDIVAQVPAFPGSKQMKTILKNVRGVVNKGEFLALMGPSGAGKSTLLNVLGTRFDGEYSGQVLINGEPRTKRFKKYIGYVLQNDVLMPNLTVRESFEVTARLRLPESVSAEQRKERIDDIIHILGLSKCEHTMVQMVSGGERKRVSVGNEMLINPSVLFLDEPTSGLDSTSAYNMLLTLKELCRQGRTVICAIHQPSSQMFAKFDRLLLLAWGNVIFHGNASDAIQYFSKVGYPCPMHFNPADFLLELITDTFQSENELFQNKGEIKSRLIQAWKETGEDMMKEKESEENHKIRDKQNGHHNAAKTLQVSVNNLYTDENNSNKDADQIKWATSWWTQFRILMYRAYRHRRGNIVTPLRVFDVMSISILAGIIYFRVKRTEAKIADFMGACFFIQIYVTFMTMFRSVMYFPTERQVIRKERQSGAYQLTSYYCGKIVAEFPVDSVLPLMAVTIFYWFVGMGDNFGTYILYLLCTCLTVWTANSFGTMAGCALDFERAITALSVSGLFLMLLGGFYVKTSSIPVWISWVGYISHFRWAVVTSESVLMPHVSFECAEVSSYSVCQTKDRISGKDVLDWYGTETRVWFGPMMLLILSTCWHIIAYFCLRHNTAVKNALGGDKPLAIIEDDAHKSKEAGNINKEENPDKKVKDINTEEAHDSK